MTHDLARFQSRVHFVSGFLVGALLGLWLLPDSDSRLGQVAATLGAGLAIGALAGRFHDAFWAPFLRSVGHCWWQR